MQHPPSSDAKIQYTIPMGRTNEELDSTIRLARTIGVPASGTQLVVQMPHPSPLFVAYFP